MQETQAGLIYESPVMCLGVGARWCKSEHAGCVCVYTWNWLCLAECYSVKKLYDWLWERKKNLSTQGHQHRQAQCI